MGHFVLGLDWIATAFTYQAAMPAWLGWVAVVMLSIYLAVDPDVTAGLAWRWGRDDPARFPLIFAAAWIVTEWLRATMFTGFAWNPLGVLALGGSTATNGAADLCALDRHLWRVWPRAPGGGRDRDDRRTGCRRSVAGTCPE